MSNENFGHDAARHKLATYRRICMWVVIVLAIVLLLGLLVGLPFPVIILIPASVILLLALIAWIALILIDRKNSTAHGTQGESWRPEG